MATVVEKLHPYEAAKAAGREPFKVRNLAEAEFDRKELRLSGPTFDYMNVPAAYNTVMLTKLLMMEPGIVNDLIGKLAPAGEQAPARHGDHPEEPRLSLA